MVGISVESSHDVDISKVLTYKDVIHCGGFFWHGASSSIHTDNPYYMDDQVMRFLSMNFILVVID